jgi:hypothetical protein
MGVVFAQATLAVRPAFHAGDARLHPEIVNVDPIDLMFFIQALGHGAE